MAEVEQRTASPLRGSICASGCHYEPLCRSVCHSKTDGLIDHDSLNPILLLAPKFTIYSLLDSRWQFTGFSGIRPRDTRNISGSYSSRLLIIKSLANEEEGRLGGNWAA